MRGAASGNSDETASCGTRAMLTAERPADQALVRLEVPPPRALHDVVRQRRRRRRLVPRQALEVVADELLVVARLVVPRLVAVRGPEAAAVRREHLVDQDQPPVRQPAELELRVGD